jgi:hypothetical protein
LTPWPNQFSGFWLVGTFAEQILGEDMVSSGVGSFTKLAACPSSRTLLDYRLATLAPEMSKLVRWHLDKCDFCWAEMRLLVHLNASEKEEGRSPSIPVNLRVLAEALFFNSRAASRTSARQAKR